MAHTQRSGFGASRKCGAEAGASEQFNRGSRRAAKKGGTAKESFVPLLGGTGFIFYLHASYAAEIG